MTFHTDWVMTFLESESSAENNPGNYCLLMSILQVLQSSFMHEMA